MVRCDHSRNTKLPQCAIVAAVARGYPSMREPKEKLLDILESIERIEKYAMRGREVFER